MFERNIRPKLEIYRAEVIEVYPERGTCDLRTRDTESKFFREVPWSSPFADIDGAGIDFCPTEGQMCYMLANTSNAQEIRGISSVILGWSFPELEGSYGEGRELLSRNDLKFANRRGAKILLDANRGDLLLQSGASCGVTMYRMSNFMHLLSDSYMVETRGGHVLWETSGEDDGEDRVRYSCAVKSRAGDDVGFLRILASSDRLGDFFEVTVTDGDSQSGQYVSTNTSDIYKRPSQYAKIRFSSDGRGVIHTASRLDLSANDEVRIRSKGAIRAEANSITGEANSPASSDTSSFNFEPNNARIVTDDLEIEAKSLRIINRADGEVLFRTADNALHQDSENKRLFNEDLQHWLFNHTHPTASGLSLPPLGRPSDVPINLNGQILNERELSEAIHTSEIGFAYRSRSLAGMSLAISSLIALIRVLPGGEVGVQALLATMQAQGLIPQGRNDLTAWFAEVSSSFLTEAESVEQQSESIEFDALGNPVLSDQQYGVSSVNDVITQDTKVR